MIYYFTLLIFTIVPLQPVQVRMEFHPDEFHTFVDCQKAAMGRMNTHIQVGPNEFLDWRCSHMPKPVQ